MRLILPSEKEALGFIDCLILPSEKEALGFIDWVSAFRAQTSLRHPSSPLTLNWPNANFSPKRMPINAKQNLGIAIIH
jgi:hypothetical protein